MAMHCTNDFGIQEGGGGVGGGAKKVLQMSSQKKTKRVPTLRFSLNAGPRITNIALISGSSGLMPCVDICNAVSFREIAVRSS